MGWLTPGKIRTVTSEFPFERMAAAIRSADRIGTCRSIPPCRIKAGQCTRRANSNVRLCRTHDARISLECE